MIVPPFTQEKTEFCIRLLIFYNNPFSEFSFEIHMILLYAACISRKNTRIWFSF